MAAVLYASARNGGNDRIERTIVGGIALSMTPDGPPYLGWELRVVPVVKPDRGLRGDVSRCIPGAAMRHEETR